MKKATLLLLLATCAFPLTVLGATFTRNLGYGSSGTEVAQLQQFLVYEGAYSGPVSGYFGTLTTNGLITFQQQESIVPASGYFGVLTRNRANKILISHPEWVTQLSNNNYYRNVNGSTVHSPSYSTNGIPAGASARCRDGTYSFSMNRRGTCSHHGGVSQWF